MSFALLLWGLTCFWKHNSSWTSLDCVDGHPWRKAEPTWKRPLVNNSPYPHYGGHNPSSAPFPLPVWWSPKSWPCGTQLCPGLTAPFCHCSRTCASSTLLQKPKSILFLRTATHRHLLMGFCDVRPFSRKEKKTFCVCFFMFALLLFKWSARSCAIYVKWYSLRCDRTGDFMEKHFVRNVPSYVALETREVELEVRQGYEYGEPGYGKITREATVQPGWKMRASAENGWTWGSRGKTPCDSWGFVPSAPNRSREHKFAWSGEKSIRNFHVWLWDYRKLQDILEYCTIYPNRRVSQHSIMCSQSYIQFSMRWRQSNLDNTVI